MWICSKLEIDLLENLFIMLGLSHTNENWGMSKVFLGSFYYFKKRKDQFIGQKKLRLVINVASLKRRVASAKEGQEYLV